MGRAQFDHADFLAAARALSAERGPAAATVDAIIERLKAPKGSFYHRFASRDALLGELWLATVLAFQERVSSRRSRPATGSARRFTCLPGRVGTWTMPDCSSSTAATILSTATGRLRCSEASPIKTKRVETCLRTFARQVFGRAGPGEIRRATFVLAEVPAAAVKQHLQRREPPPPLVDELITKTYRAIVGRGGGGRRAAESASTR